MSSLDSCPLPSISDSFGIEDNTCLCVFTSSLCPWHAAGLMTAAPQIFAKVVSLIGGQERCNHKKEDGILKK